MSNIINVILTPSKKHTQQAVQIGNYCYLIAGIEMLLSCELFVKYIYFTANKQVVISKKIIEYIERPNNDNIKKIYSDLEDIILSSFDIVQRGHSEDINLVFLYFEKDPLYIELFSQSQYSINLNRQVSFNVIIIIDSPKNIITDINIFCKAGIHAVAINNNNHYEIFCNDGPAMRAVNTNILLPCQPRSIIIFCTKRIFLKITL